MSKDWFERLENHLPQGHPWHPISTAPYNQELEICVLENDRVAALEFPCLRTNDEIWINVDLGITINIEPVKWRAWHRSRAPQPHHAKIRLIDRSTITHHQIQRREDDDDDNLA